MQTYVALREARVAATSPADFERRKAAILREHGASPEALRDFVRRHADDVMFMRGVWEEIGDAVDAFEEGRPGEDSAAASLTPTRSSTAASSSRRSTPDLRARPR